MSTYICSHRVKDPPKAPQVESSLESQDPGDQPLPARVLRPRCKGARVEGLRTLEKPLVMLVYKGSMRTNHVNGLCKVVGLRASCKGHSQSLLSGTGPAKKARQGL